MFLILYVGKLRRDIGMQILVDCQMLRDYGAFRVWVIRIWNEAVSAVVFSMIFEVVVSEVHGDNLDNDKDDA